MPRKNIRPLGGKPLLQYTAEAALAAERLDRVVLSTEDEEIADVGRACGLEVPFLRPPDLAREDTPMVPVVRHAVLWMEERGDRYDAVCLLQPTNPMRTAADIDRCVEALETSGADAVVTVVRVPAEYNPHWAYFADEEGWLRLSTGEREPIPRRQDLPPAWIREGSVYVTRRDVLVGKQSLYGERLLGVPLDGRVTVNIDGAEDWRRAEDLLAAEEP